MIVDTSALRLPRRFAEKIGTRQVVIKETDDGVLLLPVRAEVKPLYGLFSNCGLSLDRFLDQHNNDKDKEL